MATLTIADLDNGKRDLETVCAVANSRSDFTTTRFGGQTLTLAGALRRLGYAPPVAYAPGIEITTGLATVEREGIVYAPVVERVPFTTGAWDPSQWRVVQTDPNLKTDLQSPAGAGMVGTAEGPSVQEALDSTRGAVEILSDKSRGVRATRFKAAMDLNQRDVYLLMHGDSTGNETFEFFYQTVLKIAALYPSHRILYRLWNPTSEQWDVTYDRPATAGGKTLRIHNGSVPGSNPIYWHGRLKAKAYDGFQFDAVMINYGLNTSTDLTVQKSASASAIYTILRDQPDAEVIFNIQPPDYTDAAMLSRSQLRSDAQRQVAADFGVSVSDVFTLFTGLVNKSGVDAWYSDRMHPNAAGSLKWSEIAVGSLLWTSAAQRRVGVAPTMIPNASFARWENDSTPIWWTTSTTVARSQAYAESGSFAAEVPGTTGTGVFFVEITEIIARLQQSPQLYVAFRVYTEGGSDKPGTPYMSTGSGGSYVETLGAGNGAQGQGSGAYRWAYLTIPKSFYFGKTDVRLGVYTGGPGESTRIDRVLVSGDPVVPEASGVEGFSMQYRYDEGAIEVAANETINRNIDGGSSRQALRPGASVSVSTTAALPPGVILSASVQSASVTAVRITNTTASPATVPAGVWSLSAG